MDSLRAHIQSFTEFSDESWEELLHCTSPLEYKKNDTLLKEGEVCNALFFVSQGLCRSCHNRDGKEMNTAFYFENEFATNVKSLVTATASSYAIRAHERSTVVRIDKAKLLQAYQKSHQIEAFGRKALEKLTMRQEEQLNDFQLLTPRERFEKLVAQHPAFLQRVSLTQTASYLGMSRETLSRLRAIRSTL